MTNITEITSSQLITELEDIGTLGEIIDDQHWSGGMNASEFSDFAEAYCDTFEYTLVDSENLEKEYVNAYNCTEKGLS